MKRKSFGVDPLIHSGVLYDAHNTFTWDIPFYVKQAMAAKGPVLELCCGTGRITLPIAHSMIDITGVDISPSMLKQARLKAKETRLPVSFIRGDMRRLSLKRKFSLIFIPFNSLQNTYSLTDLERVFRSVHRHLKPRGRFIVDLFNPDFRIMLAGEKKIRGKYQYRTQDGKSVTVDEQTQYDSASQVVRVFWTYRIQGKPAQLQELDMRCFYPEEVMALLKYNGFKVIKRYGDFEGRAFDSSSRKQIYVCTQA